MQFAHALREVIGDKKILFPASLLLLLVLIDTLFLKLIFSELDIPEHFLFRFVLSEIASKTATMAGLKNRLVGSANKGILSNSNLIIRLFGFLFIGGLLWESVEYLLFPAISFTYNPFFKFPITLHNIDGTIDIIVGFFGCLTAWYIDRS